jgi:hypothetical protein
MQYSLVDLDKVRKMYLDLVIRVKVNLFFGEDPVDLEGLKTIARKTGPLLEEAMQNDAFNDLTFRMEMQLAFDEVAASPSVVALVGESPFVDGWYLRALQVMERILDEAESNQSK